MKKTVFKIILMLFLLIKGTVYAQFEEFNHPKLNWRTFETEHFFIHFHQGEERTPYLVAKIAEELYEPVTSMYDFEPDSKMHFIIKDTDDYSNGAAYYYDNKVVIWATPFDFILRGTINWLRNVVAHEFTHMIQLQASRKITRRIPAFYFQVIGYEEEKRKDVLYGYPNIISSYPIAGTVVPMWFAEGTAQYGAMMNGYDYWDSHRDMILRMRALHDDLLSLEEMEVFGKGSLGNESTYNQGFSLVTYIAENYGEKLLADISQELSHIGVMSSRKPIERALGISAEELYKNWKDKITSEYMRFTETIREHTVEGELIEREGISNHFPRWSPRGGIFAFLSNKESDYIRNTDLFIRENNGSRKVKHGVFSNPSWSSDGKKLVYSKLKKTDDDSYFLDIFMYDLEEDEETRLTEGARANYPAISPDNKEIVFATGADGTYNLAILDIETKQIRRITEFNNGEEIFTPCWTYDGDKIIFAVGKDVGRDIAVVNSDGTGLEYLLNNAWDERDPVLSRDGSFLYYSSDKTGIFNIYRLNLHTHEGELLTNVTGGAFMPSVNEDGELLFASYTKSGYKIAFLKNPEEVNFGYAHYKDIKSRIPDINSTNKNFKTYESSEYKNTYSQTFFLPRLFFDYGKPKIGFYSYKNDVLDRSSLFFGACINKDFDYDLFGIFEYRIWKPTVFLELYSLRRQAEFFIPLYKEKHDVKFSLLEVDAGFSMKLTRMFDLRCALIYSRMIANDKPYIEGILLSPFRYNYYKGKDFTFTLIHENILNRSDSEINPSKGRKVIFEYHREYNRFIRDFEYGAVITEIFDHYDYNRIMLKWKEYFNTPVGVLSFYLNTGYIDRPVDDFFYIFAGGLPGLKAYNYYSIGGTKMLINTATHRFPLVRDINAALGPWYFDRLFGAVSFQYGNAWTEEKIDFNEFKKIIDLELRLDMFSFYAYPTKVAFNAAYGFDKVHFNDYVDGKKWRFFLQILFAYDQ